MHEVLNVFTKDKTISSLEVEMKSIYIVEDEKGNVKIGVSKNVERRVKVLSKQGGFEICRIFFTEPCSNSFEIEKVMHKYFSDKRINGEWFKVDFNIVKKILIEIYDEKREQFQKNKRIIRPEDIDILFGNSFAKENKLIEYLELIKYVCQELDIEDNKKILMYEKVFQKLQFPTSFFDVVKKDYGML